MLIQNGYAKKINDISESTKKSVTRTRRATIAKGELRRMESDHLSQCQIADVLGIRAALIFP